MDLKTFNMKLFFIITICSILLPGCGERNYTFVEAENPLYRPNVVFEAFEDLSSPKFGHLINKYRPDTIFHGETGEFERILLLRHWIKSVIPIEDRGNPYPGEGNVERMLDYALEGQGYHCGHFMRIQNAILSGYGYVTRTMGCGPGDTGVEFPHHGTNEIWSNTYNKWFMSDAKYDIHFEKDGIPLSAIEIRDEYLKNRAADIVLVKGPDRQPVEYDEEIGMSNSDYASYYTWISWDAHNDIFSLWPDYNLMLIMYEDDYFRNNTWYRGGRPHWAYGTQYLKTVEDIDHLYFTPNTITSEVDLDGDIARIRLISDTPNFKEYQMREGSGGNWVAVETEFEMKLRRRSHEPVFRAVNLAGVNGPEHKIRIKRQ